MLLKQPYVLDTVKTANNNIRQLMVNNGIQKKIQGKIEERSERTNISADKVINELAKIAFGDIRKVFLMKMAV